jgi:hypothetical protein
VTPATRLAPALAPPRWRRSTARPSSPAWATAPLPPSEDVVGRHRVPRAGEALAVVDGQDGDATGRNHQRDPVGLGHVEVAADEPAAVGPHEPGRGRLAGDAIAAGGHRAVRAVDRYVVHSTAASSGNNATRSSVVRLPGITALRSSGVIASSPATTCPTRAVRQSSSPPPRSPAAGRSHWSTNATSATGCRRSGPCLPRGQPTTTCPASIQSSGTPTASRISASPS